MLKYFNNKPYVQQLKGLAVIRNIQVNIKEHLNKENAYIS